MKQLLMIALMGGVLTGCAGLPTKTDANGVVHGTLGRGKVDEVWSLADVKKRGDSRLENFMMRCKDIRGAEDAACSEDSNVPTVASVEVVMNGFAVLIIPQNLEIKVADLVEVEQLWVARMFRAAGRITRTLPMCKSTLGMIGGIVECPASENEGWDHIFGGSDYKRPS